MALLVANTLALAAHEPSDDGPSAPSAAAPGAPTTTAVAPAPGSGAQGSAPATTAPSVDGQDGPSGGGKKQRPTPTTAHVPLPSTTMPPPIVEGYRYDVAITPTCARPGEQFTITFKLKPQGGAVLTAIYADGETHETMHSAFARDSGVITWQWKAPPVPGEGVVVTEAYDPEKNQKGRTDLGFYIAGVGEEC